MDNIPDTAAIVVTYNGAEIVDRCISSLLESTASLEVIVINNNSSDETTSILSNYNNIR